MPSSSSKFYHPYFSPAEIEYLSEKQRGKQTATQEEKVRQNACAFIETIGSRIGFPRRTIATAQTLYHRFHLFFPRKDFQYNEVALAALYVSTKEHDTLKKPRELLSVSYAIRYPELAAKSKNPSGEIDLDTVDPTMVENDRQRLLAIERLILETICFNFTARMPFQYVIKIGKEMQANKQNIKLAWRIAIDCYRTLLPLIYPPHTLAVGSLYVAALLLSFEKPEIPMRDAGGNLSPAVIAEKMNGGEVHWAWQECYRTTIEDIDDFAHTILDLFVQFSQNPSANTSPSTPSSPSPNLATRDRHASQQQQYPYKADYLIRLKIALREKKYKTRPKKPLGPDPSALYTNEKIGQNEGTVRFLFFPPDSKSND
ncbi:cyclin-like protein [Gymnopilus junonius]|uniref:Cyclin-like protein n=1 Tax=Gymnopilus junonius TaxID=109634 RepID=A0A9P5TL76_GYMJU|nr:cyclin-like protein [Gymnopilus junonius]